MIFIKNCLYNFLKLLEIFHTDAIRDSNESKKYRPLQIYEILQQH